MNPKVTSWLKRNGPLVALLAFAVLALLYLGDSIVLQRESRVPLELVPPTVLKDDPKQGAEKPAATIIEFGEFTCSACKVQDSVFKDLLNDYGNEVQIVWKDAPLDTFNQQSLLASYAARCAANQGKFWEMHDKLFENQDTLNIDLYAQLANDLQLNVDTFNSCLFDQKTKDRIQENITSAQEAQVTSTPTFFINGTKYEGYMSYQDLVTALAQVK